jgi:iron complex transport system substrate-binding protein
LEKKDYFIFASAILLFSIYVSAASLFNDGAEREEYITITDALGRDVQVNLPVRKVIIAGKANGLVLSVAYMFPNAAELLSDLDASLFDSPLFRHVDPDIDSKSVLEDRFNIEEIVAQEPDVVVLKSYMKSNLGDPLKNVGVNVVYVDLEGLDSYLRDILVLGKVFGNEERAENISSYYEEKHSSILEKTETLDDIERPRVLHLYYDSRGDTMSFMTPGASWLQTSMIYVAGGHPLSLELEGSGWNVVSFEQIARWNPEVIFIVTYTGDPSPSDVKETLIGEPLWEEIDAIANGRVYAVPDDCNFQGGLGSWESPGSRWITGLLWMAEKIDATHMDVDIREEIERFYVDFYGLDEVKAAEVIEGITGDLG